MLLQWSPSRPVTVFGSGRTCLRCSKAVDVVKRRSGSDYSHTQWVFCVGTCSQIPSTYVDHHLHLLRRTFTASSQEIGRPRRKKIATLSRKIRREFCWDPGLVSVKDRHGLKIEFWIKIGFKRRIWYIGSCDRLRSALTHQLRSHWLHRQCLYRWIIILIGIRNF